MYSHQKFASLAAVGFLWSVPGFADTQLVIKSGPSWYTGDLGKVTSVGPAWGVAVSFQLIEIVDLEFSYEGSSNHFSNQPNAGLYRNGGTIAGKFFVPQLTVVRPYAMVGIGGAHVAQTGVVYTGNTAFGTSSSYDIFNVEIPFAIGIDVNLKPIAIGARASYRYTPLRWEPGHILEAPLPPQGNIFDITANVGVRF